MDRTHYTHTFRDNRT